MGGIDRGVAGGVSGRCEVTAVSLTNAGATTGLGVACKVNLLPDSLDTPLGKIGIVRSPRMWQDTARSGWTGSQSEVA